MTTLEVEELFETTFIFDIEPSEPLFLPPATSDFALVILTWALIGWLLRLVLKTLSLRELLVAAAAGRLSMHDNVPLHSTVQPLDPQVRLRFLGYLRARVPEAPTATVAAYTNPVSIRSVELKLHSDDSPADSGPPAMRLLLDCTVSATLQLFWDVDENAAHQLERVSPSRSTGFSTTAGACMYPAPCTMRPAPCALHPAPCSTYA